ncbi:CBS and PB1 domain protein [Aspergillus ellipticus CBS 707.79]|uniref:CBS and PB1 domain protein n=1 Tax=Aspergillus ellipticus CBS 707.79 TaxID=1448320 RepID=A0A319F321_9EURO|nr:CBS and PB1 domain protein [Aspergillus ellipticus CBS 707.79]
MSSTPTFKGTVSHKTVGRGRLPDFDSHIPRPRPDTSSTTHTPQTASSDIGSTTMSAASSRQRQNQSKRDEAIRRKLEADLNKKRHAPARANRSRKAPPGTVLALKPSQALQIKPNTSIAEAAQLMAAKREDCVLVTDDDDRIAGIFTAKDLAFRVVGAGIKAREINVSEIMTKNPLCARTDTSATDALDLMVRKGFRHLPVMDENQDISGVLDITKCFYDAMEKLERAYSSSRKLYDALEGVQTELGSSQPQQVIQYVEALRHKMSGPTLETVLDGMPPTTVSVRTTVKEAASMMKENHTTALLVQDQGSITGIFTSKDIVLRVIAPGLDPATCSVVRVMTPHPDFAPSDMSIQAALRKMHDGHYLNLPVMNDAGEIVGMVDVLKLTYATLEQINTMSSQDDEGPAWNKFWLSMDHESDSMVSGSQQPAQRSVLSPESPKASYDARDSVLPNESASHHGGDEHSEYHVDPHHGEPISFPFKFKAPSGRVHRVNVHPAAGIAELVAQVSAKLGPEVEAVGGSPSSEDGKLSNTGYALSYMDNEGDTVSITTDQDLADAVSLARMSHHDKVDMFVHDPTQPPIPATLDPQPAPTRPIEEKSIVSESRSEEESLVAKPRAQSFPAQQPEEQFIAGVPNDLLLPGAIVTLAAVIAGVFILSRATSR